MAESSNNFFLGIIAKLQKQQSKRQINADLQSLNEIYLKLIGCLDLAKTRQRIRQDVKALNSTETIKLKVDLDRSNLNQSVTQAANQAQSKLGRSSTVTLPVNFELKKEKLINDLKIWKQQNSKAFSDLEISHKFDNLMSSAKLASTTTDVNTLTYAMRALDSETKALGISGLTLGDQLSKTFQRAGQWIASTFGIMTITRQIREAWQEARELDKVMTNLSKVADELADRDSFPAYLDKSIKKAKALAVEVTDLIEATTEFKKLGFTLEQSEDLAEVASILSNVGDFDIDTAIKTLTSNVNAFHDIDGLADTQIKEKALAIADKINNISNNYAIDAEGLSNALRKCAAVMEEGNTSLDQTVAMITAGNRTYADPEYLGNTLKIVTLRLRGAKVELEQMGESTENMAESTSKLRAQILALTNVDGKGGFDIMQDDDTFKSIYDIMKGISDVWSQMNDIDQAALLELISGKARSAGAASILSNMSEAAEIYQDSMESAGSATKEFERYQNSAEASVQVLKNTLMETYNSVISGDGAKKILDTGNAIRSFSNSIDLANTAIKAFSVVMLTKGIIALTTAFRASYVQLSSFGTALNLVKNLESMTSGTAAYTTALNSLAKSCVTLKDNQLQLVLSSAALSNEDRIRILMLQNLSMEQAITKLQELGLTNATNTATTATVGATTATVGFSTAVKGLGASIKAALLSNPVGVALVALTTTITLVSSAISKYNAKLEETKRLQEQWTQEAKDTISSLKSSMSEAEQTTSSLAKRYAELAQGVSDLGKMTQSQGKLSTDEYAEFLDISNQLADIYGDQGIRVGYDATGNAILNLTGNVDNIVSSLNDLLDVERKLANQKIIEEMPYLWDEFFSNYADTKTTQTGSTDNLTEYKQLQVEIFAKPIITDVTGEDKNRLEEIIKDAELEIDDIRKRHYDYISDTSWYEFDFTGLSDEDKAKISKVLSGEVETLERELNKTEHDMNGLSNDFQSYLNTWLSSSSIYEDADADKQTMMRAVLSAFDMTDILAMAPEEVFGNSADLAEWIYGYVEDSILMDIDNIDNTEIQDAMLDLIAGGLTPQEMEQSGQKVLQYLTENGYSYGDKIYQYYRDILEESRKKVDDVYYHIFPDGFFESWVDEDDPAALDHKIQEFSEKLYQFSPEDLNFALTLAIPDDFDGTWESFLAIITEAKNGITDLEKVPSTISDSVKNFNTDLKPWLDDLGDAYQKIFTEDGFDINAIDAEMLDDLREGFENISKTFEEKGIVDVFDEQALEDFLAVVSDSSTTADKAHDAFNAYASSLFYSADGLKDLNAETANAIEQMLEQSGVLNADEIVGYYLNLQKISEWGYGLSDTAEGLQELEVATESLAEKGVDLESVTVADINALETEGIISAQAAEYLRLYAVQKMLSNGTAITTADSVQALYNLAVEAGLAKEQLQSLSKVMGMFAQADELEAKGAYQAADAIRRAAQQYASRTAQDIQEELKFGAEIVFDKPKESKSGGKKEKEVDPRKEYTDEYKRQLDILKNLRDNNVITEKEYLDNLRELIIKFYNDKSEWAEEYYAEIRKYLEDLKKYYDQVLSDIQNVLKKRIEEVEDERDAKIDALENERDAREDALKEEEKAQKDALEAQQKAIKNQIKEIENSVKAKQSVIDEAEKELDLMKQANDERKKEHDLQLANWNLEKARNQKVSYVFTGDGFKYVKDDKAEREAREEVENIKFDIKVSDQEKEIDLLKEEIDVLNSRKDALNDQSSLISDQLSALSEKYDELLEKNKQYYADLIDQTKQAFEEMLKPLEDYKSRFDELAEVEEQALLNTRLESLGYTLDQVLDMDEGVFESFKSNYLGILTDLYAGNEQTLSNISEIGGQTAEEMRSYLTETQPFFDQLKMLDLTSTQTALQSAANGTQSVADGIAFIVTSLEEMGDISTAIIVGGQGEDGVVGEFHGISTAALEAQAQIDLVSKAIDEIPTEKTVTIKVEEVHTVSSSGTTGAAHAKGTVGKAFADGYNGLPHAEHNALRSEYGQPELTIKPNGTYELTTQPTISDLPKGSVIFNGEQTRRILDGQKTVISGRNFANGTENEHLPFEQIFPEKAVIFNKFDEAVKANLDNIKYDVSGISKSVNDILQRSVTNVTSRNEGSINVGEINITCPGVTESEVAKNLVPAIQKELANVFMGASLRADQWALRR